MLGNEADPKSPGGLPAGAKGSRIEVVMAETNSELEGIFDQAQFEKRLYSMASDVPTKNQALETSPTLPTK